MFHKKYGTNPRVSSFTKVILYRRNFGLSNVVVAIRKSIAISSQKRAELH
jgi:hypothetical protein|tara:strand:- start:242 stop:391 length:150 start_codon:yes stop_codon:yes gene_type:complete